ncbi:MAG: cytochrome oxidase Cu insertion factor (SCO1/SenC/PrrC family), partial [Gammaproteobacteria bacterium]
MSRSANRKKFVIIVCLFLLPLAFSFVAYKMLPEGYKPDSMSNNGQLLSPIYTLKEFNQLSIEGKSYANKDVEKIWTLVHLIHGQCEEACSRMLYDSRQTRILLSKNIKRVKRIAVLLDAEANSTMDKMWDSHPDMTVLLGSEGGVGSQIFGAVQGSEDRPFSAFLIDPLGNVMMEFP